MKYTVAWVGEREVFTDERGQRYVRAGAADPVDVEHQPKTAGLSTLKLTKIETSSAVKRAERKERREQRALRARGLA